MYNLLSLLSDLKVPAIKTAIFVVPRHGTNSKDSTYQLELELELDLDINKKSEY
jgi:hypothetical protein